MKKCAKCKLEKKEDNFSKSTSCKDGLRYLCKLCGSLEHKLWRQKNSDYDRLRRSEWNKDNPYYAKKYRKDNADLIRKKKIANRSKRNQRERIKRKEDFQFRLSVYLRNRLNAALKEKIKTGSAVKNLGCSLEDLVKHFESLFQPGMTWENHGVYGWHIDHIKPLYGFDLSDIEELKKACHFSNLQPLWAEDNLKKNKRAA